VVVETWLLTINTIEKKQNRYLRQESDVSVTNRGINVRKIYGFNIGDIVTWEINKKSPRPYGKVVGIDHQGYKVKTLKTMRYHSEITGDNNHQVFRGETGYPVKARLNKVQKTKVVRPVSHQNPVKRHDMKADKKLKAMRAGKRVTPWGTVYYEYRVNRTDQKRRY
jgi:hypothetical protein